MTINERRKSVEFVRFLVAGGLAAAANVASRMQFSRWTSLPISVVLAYIVGMGVAFLLMRHFVFPHGRSALRRQVAVFTLVNLAAVTQTLVITLLLAELLLPRLGLRRNVDLIAHIVGVCVPIVTSFIGHRQWSFR